MKSILLDVGEDTGFETRLQTALDLTRLMNGHLTCVHSTPTSSYISNDVFGGLFVLGDVLDAIVKQDEALKARVETQLGGEDVAWEYRQLEADAVGGLISRSRLHDVIVMGRSADAKLKSASARDAGEVVTGVSCPVLVVPEAERPVDFAGPAVIAWNGSMEAAQAIRQAVPLLKHAKQVHIICVEDERSPVLPPLDASQYLARHGVTSNVVRIEAERLLVEYELEKEARRLGAAYLVMGAYSRSRTREFLFGGVTRYMLEDSTLPLLMAH